MYKYPTLEQIEQATELVTLDHLASIKIGQTIKLGSVDGRGYFLHSDSRDNLWEIDGEVEGNFDLYTLEDSEEVLACVMYEDENKDNIIFEILI